MTVIPCPSRTTSLSALQNEPMTSLPPTAASKSGPSSSIVRGRCPCLFFFLLVTLMLWILSSMPRGSREKAGQHERGDIPSVTKAIFPACSYSEVQTFPFSIPPTVQSLFFLAGKAPAAARK